ncbi:menaquinone biosynthesis protein [Paenibacillus aurantius]|uniref:Chorismate dehydratase n=1 Tax=Paenibacillus aurantius TaxID=2918900 RepID=A0AA96L9Q4_9BACL|nr:menaquinone biosynthesis protein [Paenibacillus aurantius]WNQ09285.1 menaquinone biosynthesis protein [Paenibacillus aurantius]
MNNRRFRLGRINFTNVWPIYYHFPEARFRDRIELVSQVPTMLNQALAEGEIDASPVSSFAYGANFKDYVLLPDLSVSAGNRVKSILLFHEKPIEEIANGRVMLPTTSATSVNLLKILLEKFHQGRPDYRYAAPSLEEMMQEADAALLIGDDAIRAGWANTKYKVTDLGEEWHRLTGLGMTFAVWVVRKQAAEAAPELINELYEAFLGSKEQGLRDPGEMIAEAADRIGGTEEYWKQYFANLCYDFGPDQWKGLELYYRYAYELGLVHEPVDLQIWGYKSAKRVKQ